MIRAIIVLVGFFVAGCSQSPEIPNKLTAPTVPKLSDVDKPSTVVVSGIVRKQQDGISRTRHSNQSAAALLQDARRESSSLRGQLSRSIQQGSADRARLVEMERSAIAQEASHQRLESTLSQQSTEIEELEGNNLTLAAEVSGLTYKVAVSNQRLTDTYNLLDAANARIEAVTAAQHAAVDLAEEAALSAEAFKTSRDLEKKWKWIFFWWAVSTSLFLVAVAVATFHPGIPFGFKLLM